MDKKKQFQKQLLTSKIKEHTIILSTLEKSYNDLINNSNITISNQNSINIDKLNVLHQDKSILENNKKTIKQKINNLTTNISQLDYNLKQLPLDTKDILTKEINILNDEHQRIENDRLETITSNIENINKANLDKEQLLKDIELLKVNTKLQANVITNIQKESHSSRKNILESLKEKKQLKIKLNNTIENSTITVNTFIQQINNLNNEINNLIEFKKLLVNYEYNTETNTDDVLDANAESDSNTISKLPELETYHKLYNIDNNILLNDKLNKLDDIITNNKNQILLFNTKLSKTETLNNYSIKNNINNYYNSNSNKVLTYKDTFKIEKEKQTQLEITLDTKLTLYNNYETLIIDKINNDFKTRIECLNLDKLNANKRLHIIKLRMNKDYENKKKELKKQIEDTKQEMQKQNEYIYNINNNIKIATTTIEKTNILNDELYILENKIKKHKDIISITEKDLNIINNL
jgi:hypothetical protein